MRLNLPGIFRVRFAYWNIRILGRIERFLNWRRGWFRGDTKFVQRRSWMPLHNAQMPGSAGTDTRHRAASVQPATLYDDGITPGGQRSATTDCTLMVLPS